MVYITNMAAARIYDNEIATDNFHESYITLHVSESVKIWVLHIHKTCLKRNLYRTKFCVWRKNFQSQRSLIEIKLGTLNGNYMQKKEKSCFVIGRFHCIFTDLISHFFPQLYYLNSKILLAQTWPSSSNILRFPFHCSVNLLVILPYWLDFPIRIYFERSI